MATFNLGVASPAGAGGLVIDHLGLHHLLPLAAAVAMVSAAGLAGLRLRRTAECESAAGTSGAAA